MRNGRGEDKRLIFLLRKQPLLQLHTPKLIIREEDGFGRLQLLSEGWCP